MPATRQLAAIMFADIVGYSALMHEDEANTMSLRDKLKSKLEAELALHGGKMVKFSGDGALCSFDSAIESIKVAIAVQLHMQEDPKIPLRIGIHQADVVFEEGDVHGDGVNIASRLESLATAGSILVSAKIYDEIKNQKDIQAVSLGKYMLKNIGEPLEIFSICNPGLEVPLNKKLEGKGIKYVSDKISIKKRTLAVRAVIIIGLIAALGYLLIPGFVQRQNARNQMLPAIQKMLDDSRRVPLEAFDMALEVEKYIPNDSALIELWPFIASTISISTEPEGAEVFWKEYAKPDEPFRSAGTTPITDLRVPLRNYLRMEIRKEGYETIEYAYRWGLEISLKLDPLGSLPENMIRIPEGTTGMYIVGLEQEGGKQVGEFLIDRYEVTNRQFKEFVDAGGYTNSDLWEFPILSEGQEISLSTAWQRFVDKTGRQGPSTWEAGTYPDGLEDHPVTGISWYEAAAYAASVGKQLPTIFHWGRVAATAMTEYIVPLSNYSGRSTVPVGSTKGYSYLGVYDLAGNAREWCFNESSRQGQRFIFGGGWNDQTYSFNDSYTQSAMDRSTANGFRCIKTLPDDTTIALLSGTVTGLFRDYRQEKPVDDMTFSLFLNQFVYDKKPLNPTVEKTVERDLWRAEKISFDAGYNNERIQAWVYLPKAAKPPFQPIIYFPGSGVIHATKFEENGIKGRMDFILKSGRAFVWPVYKGTFERHDELNSDLPAETVFYKDHVVMWGKEIGRTIDYLESRPDIQADKLGYLGFSWGGFMGGILPAVEKRIKAIVLNVGGMAMNSAFPEVDQINYLPRVTQPVLMLNGKHDGFFPVETSQKPMFDLIGTPLEDKRRVVFEVGHLVPQNGFVKETLLWFDQYLGPVK